MSSIELINSDGISRRAEDPRPCRRSGAGTLDVCGGLRPYMTNHRAGSPCGHLSDISHLSPARMRQHQCPTAPRNHQGASRVSGAGAPRRSATTPCQSAASAGGPASNVASFAQRRRTANMSRSRCRSTSASRPECMAAMMRSTPSHHRRQVGPWMTATAVHGPWGGACREFHRRRPARGPRTRCLRLSGTRLCRAPIPDSSRSTVFLESRMLGLLLDCPRSGLHSRTWPLKAWQSPPFPANTIPQGL